MATDYDFQQLSPAGFEVLTRDILNDTFDWELHSYSPGADGGVDLRQEDPDGRITVVQCKHYARSTAAQLRAKAVEEGKRAGSLSVDRYMFVTSRPLSTSLQDAIRQALNGLPVMLNDIWGREKLNEHLSPDVERRHPELWLTSAGVLDTVINAGRWNRTEFEWERVKDTAQSWVEREEYESARAVLDNEGVCVLFGPPGIGKTALARMLLLAMSRDKWRMVHVRGNVEEAWQVPTSDPGAKHVFWYDHFLGDHVSEGVKNEAGSMEAFINRVRSRASRQRLRLLMTVREQTLGEAAVSYSDSLRNVAGMVTAPTGGIGMRVADQSLPVRDRMLRNHLHFSNLPDDERDPLWRDNRLAGIVRHPGFNPGLVVTGISRAPELTADSVLGSIERTLDRPEEMWGASFEKLGQNEKDILLTLATLPARRWPLYDLVLPLSGASRTLDWKSTERVLVPTWLVLHRDHAELAGASCRAYLLDHFDHNTLHARRCVERVQCAEQVAGLSAASGVSRGGTARRPNLAQALKGRRSEFAALVRSETSGTASPRELADAAELLAVYGAQDDFVWLASRTDAVTGSPASMFRLAERVAVMHADDVLEPDMVAVALRTVARALSLTQTEHELDVYAALPAVLRTPENQALASAQARGIITTELEYVLTVEEDPLVVRSVATDAAERAAWYGVPASDITPLLDRATDRAEDLKWQAEECATPQLPDSATE